MEWLLWVTTGVNQFINCVNVEWFTNTSYVSLNWICQCSDQQSSWYASYNFVIIGSYNHLSLIRQPVLIYRQFDTEWKHVIGVLLIRIETFSSRRNSYHNICHVPCCLEAMSLKAWLLSLTWRVCKCLDVGQVTKLGLSCYLVLLSIDSKPGNNTASVPWPDPYICLCGRIIYHEYH